MRRDWFSAVARTVAFVAFGQKIQVFVGLGVREEGRFEGLECGAGEREDAGGRFRGGFRGEHFAEQGSDLF